MFDTAILIITYNRPDLCIELIDDLSQKGFNNIWVTLDGPKNFADKLKQKDILEYMKSAMIPIKHQNLFGINYGCRNGVIKGITWFFKHNREGIIIEDDVRIDKAYIEIMGKLLKTNREDKTIFSISSHYDYSILKENYTMNKAMIVKSPLCRVWGWATWADRWNIHLKYLETNRMVSKLGIFLGLPKTIRTKELALRIFACKSGHMKAWDYEWNLTHVKEKAYSLTPNKICSVNKGFRSDGTHTVSGNPPWDNLEKWPIYEINKYYEIVSEKDSKVIHRNCGLPKTMQIKTEFRGLLYYIITNKVKAGLKRIMGEK